MNDALEAFAPAVASWFRARYGEPTPPQAQGWPAIQRGEHALILSPTGSGKTMAAFLWGIDRIYRDLVADPALSGVQLVYVSPLKALNNDIERNLREPLAGIRRTADRLGASLPPLRVAVRTGDTPSSERQRMLRQPPHILITTPESLYLLLTSVQASAILDTVHTVIVDEIHTLCGNKRGVHLAISLERLVHRTPRPPQRIGLSATQRPLEEVARFLGGQEWVQAEDGTQRLEARPVTIVDASARKLLDLRVVTVLPDLRKVPGGSIWPFVIPSVLTEIRQRRTTLVFTNGRRAAERAADRLNEQYAVEEEEEVEPGSPSVLMRDGVGVARGMFGTGRVGGPFRAHHGSVSKEVRLQLEDQLKAGQLPALIGTSSLELGIDIGYVDAVIQLESPHGVARGLQRVGRSGHLVGQTSVGRIYPLHREDLLDAGAVAHGMLKGDIEPTYTPRNCLDVLAQQIVAMVAMQDWAVDELYRLVCRTYGYHELTYEAYRAVLEMLSGKYPSTEVRALRPRISWDKVNGRLAALPGTRLLAVRNGGTIPDQGQFGVYLADRKTLLGALDEEFVFETRTGDVFTLGSSTWRVLEIDEHKLVVAPAPGLMPRMPFWHGEAPHRDYHMGLQVGAFRRQLAERAAALATAPDDSAGEWPPEATPILQWLMVEYAMDEASARNALHYVRLQLDVLGAISSDDTVVVEQFSDALGDQRIAVHSCFGGRVNSAWALALSQAMRERLGREVEVQVNDDGILFRIAQADREPPLDLVRALGAEEARERLLTELPNSAMFGAHFRMNAARALLLPGMAGNRRTPFWLQRLRAKDLLAAVKGYQDFPIVAETMRDCLRDVLDVEHLMTVLEAISTGAVRIVQVETVVPSPVASALLFDFASAYLYDGDLPKAERQLQALAMNRELLSQLIDEGMLPDLLRPEAISGIERELQHLAEGYKARSVEELALVLHELGDLSAEEVAERSLGDGAAWLQQLAATGRAVALTMRTPTGTGIRWVAAEDSHRYQRLGTPDDMPEEVLLAMLRTYVRTRGPFMLAAPAGRYGLTFDRVEGALTSLVEGGHLIAGRLRPGAETTEWCDRHVLERIHQRTLSVLRREVQPVSLAAYADLQVRWQHLHPVTRLRGESGLHDALRQLRGAQVPAVVWERDLLSTRVEGYALDWLDALGRAGELIWVATGADARRAQATMFGRGEGQLYLPADAPDAVGLSETGARVWEVLHAEGASGQAELREALGLGAAELDAALVELTLAGLVTNTQWSAMRRITAGEASSAEGSRGLHSSLDAELESWRLARRQPLGARPSYGRLREAQRRASQHAARRSDWPGEWSPVRRLRVMGAPLDADERSARLAHTLLERYGIVTRAALERESVASDWGALYRHYALLEMRGDVRRGYFVAGLPGVQFALPEALEALRAWDRPDAEGSDSLVIVNACDPANVQPTGEGGEGGLASVLARLPSNYYVQQRGVAVLTYEHGAHRWTALPQAGDGVVARAVRVLLAHLTAEGGLCARPRRVYAYEWNGASPIGAPAQTLLESLGWRREPHGMVWDGA